MATHPNSPKGALLRHGYTLHKDPRYPNSQRRTVKDSAGVVVLDDAPLDAVCDFCKRNGLYLPEQRSPGAGRGHHICSLTGTKRCRCLCTLRAHW